MTCTSRAAARARKVAGTVMLMDVVESNTAATGVSLMVTRELPAKPVPVIVTIAATGVGIHAAGLGQLFAKPKPGALLRGRGLSLYVARLLAKTMRGDVTLVSTEVENGSTFAVVFPQASKMAAADPAAEPAAVSKA